MGMLAVVIGASYPQSADARGLGRALRVARAAGAAAKVYGAQSSGEHVLTVTELAECLRKERAISVSEAHLSAEAAWLSAEVARIESLSASLEREGKTLNEYDATAVDRYNAKVRGFRKAASGYEQREKSYNVSVDARNALGTAYNQACYGKSYYEDDYASAAMIASQ